MAKYFVRFPSAQLRTEARPMLQLEAARMQPFFPGYREDAKKVLIADLSDEERKTAEQNGAEIYEDVQFYPVGNPLEFPPASARYWEKNAAGAAAPMLAPPPWMTKTQNDVMSQIRAPQAWTRTKGSGVTIGIVDTGIAGTMSEFPFARRSPQSYTFSFPDGPWNDAGGHGSMCASAAAASMDAGGRYNGVAPESLIMSLRTTLQSTDIYKLYEHVIISKRAGHFPGPVVLSNSYGIYTCSPPSVLPQSHPYLQIVRDAVSEGIAVVFAAGNNHAQGLCGWDPNQCNPNSIWGVNSIDEVLSVGTVNWNEAMNVGEHANSSRGPGQWASTTTKPDCVAPTYGEIIWGSGYQHMEWWGTSGACPQVAGLCALIFSQNQGLTPQQVYDRVRSTCRALPLGPTCAGAGIIDCDAAT
jgi:serine protease AprX